MDTKLDTKTTTATTKSSLADEPVFWRRFAVSPRQKCSRLWVQSETHLRSATKGNSKPDNCSTCRRNTEGFIPSEPQISKILRRDGFVLPNSMRLMKARSYPDL